MSFSYPFVETRSRAGWESWDRYGVDVDAAGRLVLAADPVPAFDVSGPLGADAGAVRDIALDDCGELTLLSATGELFQYEVDRELLTRLSCLPGSEERFVEPRALAFAGDSLYVAHQPAGEPRIQAFSRHLFQRRWTVSAPFAEPVAMVERGGRLCVLDRGEPRDDSPDAADRRGFVATVDEDARTTVAHEGLGDVVDFAVDARRWLYVLVRTDEASEDGEPRYTVRVFDANDEPVESWPDIPTEAFPHRDGVVLPLSCLAVSSDGSFSVGVAADFESGGGVYRLPRPETTDESSDAGSSDGGDGEAEGDEDDGTSGPRQSAADAFVRLSTVRLGCRVVLLDESREPRARATVRRDRSEGASSATQPSPADPESEEAVPDGDHTGRLFVLDATGDGSTPTSTGTAGRVFRCDRRRRNLASRGGPGRFAGRAVRRFDADEAWTVWHRIQTTVSTAGPGTQVRLRYVALDADAPGETDESTADEADGARDVVLPAPPEGFARIPALPTSVADRLREANVLGVAGLARLGVDEVHGIVSSPSAPVSRARVDGWLRAAETLASQWEPLPITPPTDALLDEDAATGRSLWVEVELLGDEFATPAVDSFRAYFPRESYLQHLPAIYRENPSSAAFLTRFLSLFESTYVRLEAEFAGLTRYFDADGVPEEHLQWLADWVGVPLDDTWSVATRRAILARASELSKRRGTRAGLTALVELVLQDVETQGVSWAAARDHERRTVEALADDGFVDDAEAALSAHDTLEATYEPFTAERVHLWEFGDFDCVDGEAARETFHGLLRCPQCFVVLVRAAATDEQWRALERLVEAQTPAHAVGDVVELDSAFALDSHTYLGVNSVVADGAFVVDAATLERDSTLGEREPRGQLDVGARLGRDARLS